MMILGFFYYICLASMKLFETVWTRVRFPSAPRLSPDKLGKVGPRKTQEIRGSLSEIDKNNTGRLLRRMHRYCPNRGRLVLTADVG
jgi:hypothetical protein